MNNYKHYLAGYNNLCLGIVYAKTVVDEESFAPRLSNFVKLIDAVKFEDGRYYNYYFEIKAVLKSFFINWRDTRDAVLKRDDYHTYQYEQSIDRELMVLSVVTSIRELRDHRKKFFKEFLPIESAQQQKIYDDLEEKFKIYIHQLVEMKTQVEKMDRPEYLVAFVKEQIAKGAELGEKLSQYSLDYISMMLADRLPEIDGSLKEIINQTWNNLKQLEEQHEGNVSDLFNKLYDQNKEHIKYTHRKRGSVSHVAELCNNIDKIRTEVLNSGNHEAIEKVREKLELFKNHYATFEKIAMTLKSLKVELEKTYLEENVYNSRTTTELPGTKHWCWEEMGKNIAKRKVELKKQLLKAANALTTFFVVRSSSYEHMHYQSDPAPLTVDAYGHVVYHLDSGLRDMHLDCKGNQWMPGDELQRYYDENGKYFLQDGEKIYQKDDCGSLYKLGDDTLLKKISTDCGHSEMTKRDCMVTIKPKVMEEILPSVEPVDIKNTLNAEVTKYLWDSFGSILPDALFDVCQQKPKNPINSLAHCLLKHKYNLTPAQLLKKKKESDAYRAGILKDRKEKKIADTLEWKSKLTKRRKPEESDDSYNKAIHDVYVTTNEFIKTLNFYNDY